MARGEVARLCRVGEGKTSSGRNSGSSAKRSSKYTSDSTLPDQHAHTHTKYSIYTLPINHFCNLMQKIHKGVNSLVHRVKSLLKRGRAGFDLFGCRTIFVSLWGWQGGFCGWWRGERRGGEGLLPSSLHRKLILSVLYKVAEMLRVVSSHYVSAESQCVMFLSPLWWLCFPCSVCQRSPLHWSPPGVCHRMAAPRQDVLMETQAQRRND